MWKASGEELPLDALATEERPPGRNCAVRHLLARTPRAMKTSIGVLIQEREIERETERTKNEQQTICTDITIHIYIYIHTYICMYMHAYLYTHKH